VLYRCDSNGGSLYAKDGSPLAYHTASLIGVATAPSWRGAQSTHSLRYRRGILVLPRQAYSDKTVICQDRLKAKKLQTERQLDATRPAKVPDHKKRSAFCVLRFAFCAGPYSMASDFGGPISNFQYPYDENEDPFLFRSENGPFPPAFNTPKGCFILPRQARGKLRGNSTKRDRFSLQEQARRVRGAVPRQHLDGLARQPHPRRDRRWCEMLYSLF
jgi:hypothetical protein